MRPPPSKRAPDLPPPSPADQWAAQQQREAREKAGMNRIIGLVVLAGLILWGLLEHWIRWPF